MSKPLILSCPACAGELEATRLSCPACSITIEGHFVTSPFARLSQQQQQFVNTFLAARGNIKLVEAQLGISYPTVRSRLDAIRQALGLPDLAAGEDERPGPKDVLDRLAAGELTADEAIDLLQ